MADYKVTDTELTAVADAIRTKGGTSADLEWNSGFISAIEAISGGGGSGDGQIAEGTFTSASTQYGIVDIDCGFEPDAVIVTIPFSAGNTLSWWFRDRGDSSTNAIWDLRPTEYNQYMITLGRTEGETGIQQININGFSFMSNAENTRNVVCKYIAVKCSGV